MVVQPTLLENLLIIVGESFWVFSAAAQLRRLGKTHNTRGLSAPSQTLNAAGNIGWCTYFAIHHLWFPFVTNIIVISLTIAILGFTLSNRRQFVRGLVTIAIVGPLTSYLLIAFPADSGWLGMAYNWLAGTPQLIRIVSRKKVSGLSEKSMYFAMGAMILVFIYAKLIHSVPLIAESVQGLTYMLITLKYYYGYRQLD